MASTFTEKILTGCTFKEFASDCARAFWRDCDKVPENFQEEDFYPVENLKRAKSDLVFAKKLTIEEAEKLAEESHNRIITNARKEIQKQELERAKFNQMLAKVKLYNPTSNLRGHKKFLISQIKESLVYCSSDRYENQLKELKMTGIEYKKMLIDTAEREIKNYLSWIKKDKKNLEKSNNWLKDLREGVDTAEKLIRDKGLE